MMAQYDENTSRLERRRIILLLRPLYPEGFIENNTTKPIVTAIEQAISSGRVYVPKLVQSTQGRYDRLVKASRLVIGDLDGANINVTYLLNIALECQKKLILIAPIGRAMSVPVAELTKAPLLYYDPDSIEPFLNHLARLIKEVLDEDQSNLHSNHSNIAERGNAKSKVIISYNPSDSETKERLLVHLKPLQKQGKIDLWEDSMLMPGDEREKEVTKALERSQAAILIFSADYMASDFITDKVLSPLLVKAASGGTTIIPLIAKPCRYARDESLSKFQPANNPKESLISLSEAQREEIYDRVASQVEAALARPK